ncbi:MAG: hypothetical protein EBS71_09630, partial [Actinobacteria bacterium]|nr:hypothetical protein [Actinomycetota bacterium]
GTLTVGNTSALGGTSGNTSVSSGATLEIGAYSIAEPLSLAGTGVSSAGALNFTAGGTVSGTVAMSAAATIQVASSYTATVSGVVSGTGSLTKSGAGTLTLTGGATGTNTNSGGVSITAGTLSVAADLNLGAAPGSVSATSITLNGGTLQASSTFILSTNRGITLGASHGTIDVSSGATLTYAGIIAGTSTNLTKTGTGALSLSGASTYTGTTTVSAGTLTAGGSTALGTNAGGTSVSSGATLKISTSTSEPLTLAGDGVSSTDGALNLPTSSVTASGTISLSANTTIKVESGVTSVTLSGVISGSGTLTKTGAGALTLSGTNTYTGTTAVNDGDLNLSNNDGLGASGATQGTTVASGASLKVGSLVTNSAEPLTIAGTGYLSYGALFFNGGGKFSGTVSLSGDATIRVTS